MNYGHDCRVFMLPARYFSTYTSFALPRDSPLVPLMNKLILDIVSSGLLRKWWTELSYSTTDCSALEATPIELKTVLTPFLLLGLSALVSLGILPDKDSCLAKEVQQCPEGIDVNIKTCEKGIALK
ncbi:uncharacterized protein [Penaeus vannamei]|uniref:uncharacterized protein n=1 Tax=Penaeus vannamei TaxID=6689 RepID=UPI00387F4438